MTSKPISIRLPEAVIADLEEIAGKRFLPMRTMLRAWVMERKETEEEGRVEMLPPLPTHPEARDGEITNSTEEDYPIVGYQTKRMGKTTFSRYGRPIPQLFPVFVQKSEYYATEEEE